MIATLFAQRIILQTMVFEQVPSKLKQAVADILIVSGCENLITDEQYKTNNEEK